MKTGYHRWGRALLLLSCAFVATQALADPAGPSETRHFAVGAGSLGGVVAQLARQAGREALFPADLTRGKVSPGFTGDDTLAGALTQVLQGAGLTYDLLPDGTVTLKSRGRDEAAQDPLDTVVVTAQKRRQLLTKVPISAMALSQDQLERRGVRDIADLARLSPGLSLQGADDSGDMNIAIRGIISTVGAPTTGIYLDDVPIEVRQDAAVWSNPFPKIVDLDHVEVLRGPQGTFFGGSAEGGAVRFITPDASLTKTSGFVRGGVALTSGGAPGGEIGGAYGGPLVQDKLGVRVSLWRQEEGGYASRVDPATGQVLGRNVNGVSNTAAHLNLKLQPTARLTLTPGLFYQDERDADMGLFWERESGDYTIASRIPAVHHDHMFMASLGAQYDFDAFSVKSISAYIDRVAHYQYDSTQYQFASYAPDLLFLPSDPSYLVAAQYVSSQQSYSEELRFTSRAGPEARLSWVGGLFFQNQREGYDGHYRDNMDELANYLSVSAGNGPSDALTAFGEAPVEGRYSFVRHYVDDVRETAVYANGDYRLTSRLKLSAGLRVSENSFHFHDFQDGPWGPGAPTYRDGSKSEPAVTPRVNLSYDLAGAQMVYVSAAKGYRMGGVDQPVPANLCQADLAALGLTEAPQTYNSDSLWSYEAGFKGRVLGGRVLMQSSLFWIDWSRIQQSVYLSNCGYNYIANLGEATSRGFDLQAEWSPVKALTLSAMTGFTDVYSTQTVSQDGAILAKKGAPLSTPKWTVSASAEYRFTPFAGAHGYGRLDGQYASAYDRMGPAEVYGSDPLMRKAPAVTVLSARLGVKFKNWDVALYGDNLLDAHTSLYRYRDSIDTTPLALRDERLRPLTAGLIATYAY